MDWKNLGFQYMPTNGHVICKFKGGVWSSPEFHTDPVLPLHVASNCLHYGQACFEGLKAFSHRNGSVHICTPERNAQRLRASAERICMQAPSVELFLECCLLAVKENLAFVPPYGTGASLYIRPLLIGTQPTVGLNPSEDYAFIVLVTPVGPYYKSGFVPVKAVVISDFDRAAAQGTGMAKVAGNYAAGLMPNIKAKAMGYPIALFTDPVHHKYIDEFGTSNFIGITSRGEYITPDSTSILKSITNVLLQQLAKDEGLTVIKRPILLDELSEFDEVGACGTAAVVTPICQIDDGEKSWTFGTGTEAGPTITRLHKRFTSIQNGEMEDKFGWLYPAARETPASAKA